MIQDYEEISNKKIKNATVGQTTDKEIFDVIPEVLDTWKCDTS